MGFVSSYQSVSDNHAAGREKLSAELENFAGRMRSIPRKVVHCEIYGTPRIIVDEAAALRIMSAAFARRIDRSVAYDALKALRERLDMAPSL